MSKRKNPRKQRNLHIFSEAFALLVIAPTLWQMSKRETLSQNDRSFLRTVAVGTVVVDGYLLAEWFRNGRR